MAAPLVQCCCRYLSRFRRFSTFCAQYANAVAPKHAEVVVYPPIKPRYPPGRWGNMLETSAWLMDDLRNELSAIPSVKERLEKIAGSEKRIMWLVEAMDNRPRNLEFKQRLTKTHVAEGLPAVYSGVENLDSTYESLKSDIAEAIDVEFDYHRMWSEIQKNSLDAVTEDADRRVMHRLLGRVTSLMVSRLAASNDYLVRSQMDEDVRVESFWFTGGFTGDGNEAKGKWEEIKCLEEQDFGILLFQYCHKADWQIRTELPLQKFVGIDDAVCTSGSVPHPDHTPEMANMEYVEDRPLTVSGHWIGDPCEFSTLSLHTLPHEFCSQFLELGEKYALEAELVFGMTAAFGSCVAQAYNQGFSYLHDLTYPLTTQCIVTDGQHLRLFAYQLNTLRLWLGDDLDANPLRNVVWASDRIPLFEGDSRRPNDDAFKLLLRSVLLKPSVETDTDLRPFLPDEESPAKRTIYINHRGDEPLPYEKIGRFQYPRNAVYF